MANSAGQDYGGFWARFLAYLVDSVIFFTLLFVLAAVGAFLGPLGILLIGAACLVGPILYWGVMQASARQATFGKSLLGMKVTDADGQRMSLVRSLARELAKYVSAIPLMLGFILAAFTGRKQALHDMIASTVVMRESRGHVMVALVVGLFGWVAPAALVMVVGVGLFAGMMGMLGASVVQQAMDPAHSQRNQKQVVRSTAVARAAPAPTRTAPPPAPAAPAPAKPPVTGQNVEAIQAQAPEPKPVLVPVVDQSAAVPVATARESKPMRMAAAPRKRADAPPPVQPRPLEIPAPAAVVPSAPPPKFNDLMTAVLYRDAGAVNELVGMGKWVDKPDSQGRTPLVAAAMLSDAKTAEVLLKAGADASPALTIARAQRDAAMTSLLERYAK